jgi:hypothetical protein
MDGKVSGNASVIAIELSNAISPNTTRMLVIRKKIASLLPLAKWPDPQLSYAYSISSPTDKCTPSLVPDSITQVPRLNAMVSTIQRYSVGIAIGRIVLVQGNPTIN